MARFTTITARFAGTCRRCGGPIAAGDRIRYGGRNLVYHLASECGTAPVAAGRDRSEDWMDDPEYHARRLRGDFDYRDERGIWHLE